MKLFIIKLKSILLPSLICLFIVLLLLFSKNNLSAAKSGLLLWANSVLPSLLPFFIATELLGYTDIVPLCGKLLSPIMRPIFNVPGEGAFALLMGIISGYPIGAKIVGNLKEQHLCTDIEAERLLAFTNNSGPLFIVGTVGIGLFYNASIGLILLTTHILACLTTGFLFRWWRKSVSKEMLLETLLKSRFDQTRFLEESPKAQKKYVRGTIPLTQSSPSALHNSLSFYNLGEVLSKSIFNSINTILMIGGFVVLFSIIISMLQTSHLLELIANIFSFIGIPNFLSISILTGLIEVTNGLSFICNQNININLQLPLCSFVLGFGGFSVLLQVLSITSKSKISIRPYFIGKLLQAFFSAFYTYLII